MLIATGMIGVFLAALYMGWLGVTVASIPLGAVILIGVVLMVLDVVQDARGFTSTK